MTDSPKAKIVKLLERFNTNLMEIKCPKLRAEEGTPLNLHNDEWINIYSKSDEDPKPGMIVIHTATDFKVDVRVGRRLPLSVVGNNYEEGQLVKDMLYGGAYQAYRVRRNIEGERGVNKGPSSKFGNHYVKLSDNVERTDELRSFLVADPLVLLTQDNICRIDILNSYHDEDVNVWYGIF